MPDYTLIFPIMYWRILRRVCRVARFVAVAGLFAAAGCSYKTEIRQGDTMLPGKIPLLQTGMTREEVTELIGSHNVPKVFAGKNWIYYYSVRPSGFAPKFRAEGVELVFDNDILSEIIPLSPDESPPTTGSLLENWIRKGAEEVLYSKEDAAPDVPDPSDS